MGPKVGCFPHNCHHRLRTMSAHKHVYRHPLFESVSNTSLRMITLGRKDRVLLCKHK